MAGMNPAAPKIDKAESRSIRVQIRHVLLEVWDPIGVKDEPNAQDEYDGYIGGLYELLVGQAADSELAKYLYWAAHDRMGFDASQIRDMDETVQALRQIRLPQN
jgi:hypothetical protein